MGDDHAIVHMERNKGGGSSSSITCSMLTATNYTVWSIRMRLCLNVHEVWEVVEAEINDKKKNNMAMILIFQSVLEDLILQYGELTTTKKIWDAIKTRNVGAERVKEARLQTLMSEFDRLKMKETDTIDEFVSKLSSIASKSSSLGEKIEETKMVKKFLKCLPRKKYIHMVASLEQLLDLKTASFEEVVGRLKAYEERILEEKEDAQDDHKQLMYLESPNQTRNLSEGSRGRGRGGGSRGGTRGRGRGRGDFNISKVIFYRCDKYGHFASKCPDRLLKLQETQEDVNEEETQEGDDLLLHEVVFLNEDKVLPSKFENNVEGNIWYLDNGASNHMTGDRRYFVQLDEKITGKVRFGDDSRIDIKGKGVISFVDGNGNEKEMKDVYYIPDLKSNIVR